MSFRTLDAEDLCGKDINEIVRFHWRFPSSRVQALVTGVIREIHHDGQGHVYLQLIPVDADELEGGHDKQEFHVASAEPVEILR